MRVGSLFAGIGGIDLAFAQAKHKIVWANEYDKDACKTYRHNFPETKLIEEDIKKVDFSKLEKVNLIAAGFPCQPFSICGKQKGFDDDRGNLFFEIMRAVDEIKPKVIFLENVANLTEHDNGRTFNVIHNEITERGYYIRYLVADAVNYGFPQHRTRTYIVAFKNKSAAEKFEFPEKSEVKKTLFDLIDKTSDVSEDLYLLPGSKDYEKIKKAMTDKNQIYRFSDYGVQSGKDGVSFTLKANMGTWYNRVPIIRDDYGIRKITPEECLALQGFPKEFSLPDNIPEKSKYKQAGNTVVVPVVKAIAIQIRKSGR
ncbi:MAG: DNA (cytosine-5-)-methyltransferase [Clostridiales bacterium]|nr:DNA (cytosine-5-)-methyltransferase [Clostridiales bacterium]